MSVDRSLLRWACIIAAAVFAFLWLFSVTVSGFSAPDWVPPASIVALAVAVVL